MVKHTRLWSLVLTGVILLQGFSLTNAISARIHAHPMNISLNPGVNVTLTCLVQDGGFADAIQWFKYNQPISLQEQVTSSQWKDMSLLLLMNISQADAGRYTCTVRQGQDIDTDVYFLHVNGVPVITDLSNEVTVLDGEDTSIPCAAEGWPRPTIRWKLQGDYLKDDMDYGIKPHPTLSQVTLEIRSANEDLEEQYDCEASNAFGKAEKSVYVRVVAQPKYVLVKSHYVVTSKGSNVTLTCDAPKFYWAYMTHWWTFNGTKLPKHQVEAVKVGDYLKTVLHIHNVSERNAGLYECNVLDDTNLGRNNITLIVDEKENLQNISTNWKTVEAAVNRHAHLKCFTSYSAFLKVETFWLFEGDDLNSTDPRYTTITDQVNGTETRRAAQQMSLWIGNISISDFGNYSCVVKSFLGISSERIVLVKEETEIKFSAGGASKNSTLLIILFPVLTGGLLLSLTAFLFLRRVQRRRYDQNQQGLTNDGEFKYDVFVTFSSKDRQWVTSKLTPLLEKQQLKYCIHSRDFELGRALVDNMAESVYSSRKVLAVMSKNYIDSKFCRGELEMALYRSKTGRDGSLLVVTIDGIRKKKLPKALRESAFVDYHSDTENSWEKKLMRFLEQPVEKNPNIFSTKL